MWALKKNDSRSPNASGERPAATAASQYAMPFASVYPLYVAKLEREGRTVAELHAAIAWLTGYDDAGIAEAVADGRTIRELFDRAPAMHPGAADLRGVVCGVRVEDVEDPLMQRIRWLDLLVDRLARGTALERVLPGTART